MCAAEIAEARREEAARRVEEDGIEPRKCQKCLGARVKGEFTPGVWVYAAQES